jgi:large subunit ribosomal protein L36
LVTNEAGRFGQKYRAARKRYPNASADRAGVERGSVMKVRNSLRSLKSKPGSVVTRRRGRQVVVNRKNPRWNGRQG